MKTYLIFFLISLAAVLACTPWTRSLGIRYGILDRPGSRRKIHQSAIPRSGGLAVLTATILPFLGFLFYGNLLLGQIGLYWQPLLGLALGSMLVFAVGLADDFHRLAPWKKLVIEVLAAMVAAACGMLGFGPLYVANEGLLVAFVPQPRADEAVAALRSHPLGRAATRIGKCVREHPGIVVLITGIGGNRVVDMLPGDQLPRIC